MTTYTRENATHWLRCRHCIGTSCTAYRMPCIPLGLTKSGAMKIVVFGERNWKDREHIQRVRYVNPERLVKMAEIDFYE